MRAITQDRLSNYAKQTIRRADIANSDVALVQSVYTQIGTLTVAAGTGYFMGHGQQTGRESAQGRIYMALVDTAAAAVAGTIRIVVLNPRDIEVLQVAQFDISSLKTSATDPRQQEPFPVRYPLIPRDHKIGLYVKCDDASKTYDASASTIFIDATICDVAE